MQNFVCLNWIYLSKNTWEDHENFTTTNEKEFYLLLSLDIPEDGFVEIIILEEIICLEFLSLSRNSLK